MSAAITAAVIGIGGGMIAANNKPKSADSSQNIGQTAGDLFGAYQNYAPGMFNLANQYAPQYNQLQNQMMGDTQAQMFQGYMNTSPSMQWLQNQNQLGQAGGNVNLLQQYGQQANQAYMQSNPQLQALQQQYSQMAMNQQNPVSMLGPQGGWGQQFSQNAGQMVNGAQVQTMKNPTLDAMNTQAQQQLALGSSMSQQQASTVQNQILGNYNSMGRSNDPTAIAGLATGLDTYGQQLLQQRQQNASNVAGLTNQYAGMQQAGQQANLSSQLGLAGLQYEGLYGSSQQQLQGGMANQQAQLQNANYQNQLMQGASGLAYQTGQNSFNMLMNPSNAYGMASNMYNQAGNTITAGNQLSGMYNPFGQNFNSVYGTQTGANMNNANTSAGLMSGFGNLFTNPTMIQGINNLFSPTPSSQPSVSSDPGLIDGGSGLF